MYYKCIYVSACVYASSMCVCVCVCTHTHTHTNTHTHTHTQTQNPGGPPLEFEVGSGRVISGFDEAVLGLKVMVYVPYNNVCSL